MPSEDAAKTSGLLKLALPKRRVMTVQGDKEKGLSIAYNNQAGTRQKASSASSSNRNIPRFTNASQLARRETVYLRWGTQRFRLAPLKSLRRWPHE